jgi:gluconate 2-dehydrogenase
MASSRKNVLVFRTLPEDQLARLQAVHEVVVADARQSPEAFAAALPAAQGLIGSSVNFNASMLDAAPRLEVISSVSVGVDNYPLTELRRRNIVLCHTPDVLTETVADTMFAILMATQRRVVELSTLVREGRWTKNIGEDLFGTDVHGKTLGILGFGRIGQAVARRAALGFGMPVLYHARRAVDLAAQAPELQGRATHTPLDKGTLRAAGLDVFAKEPLPADSPLRTHPRVTPLPHIGSATHETRHAMAELATTNLLQVLAGERPTARYDTASA